MYDVASGNQLPLLTPELVTSNDYWFGELPKLSRELALVPQLGRFGSQTSLNLFDLNAGEWLYRWLPSDFEVDEFWYSTAIDGQRAAFNSEYDGSRHPVHVVDLSTGEEILRLAHGDGIDIAGDTLIVGDKAGNVAALVDVTTGETLHELEPAYGELNSLLFSVGLSDSLAYVVSETGPRFQEESMISIFDVPSGELISELEFDRHISGPIDLDGNYAVVGFQETISRNPRVDRISASVFDIRTGEEVFIFPELSGATGGYGALSGNTAIFAAATNDELGGVLYVATLSGLLGDIDGNGFFEASDIDALAGQLRQGSAEPSSDVNSDGILDAADLVSLVEDVGETFLGDANLDQHVNFLDFLTLSSAFGQAGGWADGDFDGSGDVAFPDFLLLSENFGQSNVAASSVPEPSGSILTVFALAFALTFRRRRRC